MKKSNRSLILKLGGYAVALAFIVFLIVQNKSLGEFLFVAGEEVTLAQSKNIVLESNVILSARSTNKQFSDSILLTDTKNRTHTTAEIFSGKTPCLVFRYSSVGGCSSCTNTVFRHLDRLKNSVDSNKLRIVIIPNEMELRQVIAESTQSIKNRFTFYLADENGLGLPVDEALVSYLFIAEENKTSRVFVVDKMFLPLLEKYVNVLIENYKQ
jgi:hypothetical protein